jgi:hypothetical protein
VKFDGEAIGTADRAAPDLVASTRAAPRRRLKLATAVSRPSSTLRPGRCPYHRPPPTASDVRRGTAAVDRAALQARRLAGRGRSAGDPDHPDHARRRAIAAADRELV